MSDNKTLLENQTNGASLDRDSALDSFISREPAGTKPVKTHRPHQNILILIIAAVVVAALAALLIFLRSHPAAGDDETEEPAAVTMSVNENGGHEAAVATDENGDILHNGAGELLSYVPADISQIDVENADGSFTVTAVTPEGEATRYTLVGFEDYALQDGIADSVASAASSLAFTRIISADGSPADFGLDAPRAVVNVGFCDDTTAVIRIGSEAAGDAGTYLSFGSGTAVYLVDSASVEAFLYSVNEFISLAITDAAEDTDSSVFSELTISGTHYAEPITITPNEDEAVNAAYIVTAPRRMYANATESFDIAGSVRGLYAEYVICVNPSESQLGAYGLDKPYATVKAVYPDVTITLHSSAPSDNGTVHLYNPDKNIVYDIQLGAVTWAKTNLDALAPETVIDVNLTAVSEIRFTAGDRDYVITVQTDTQTVTNDDGDEEEITTTAAAYQGTTLDEDNFAVFFQNLNQIKNQGSVDGTGNVVMSFTVAYATGRASDTVTVYDIGGAYDPVALNGEIIGSAGKSYIDRLIQSADSLVNGETVSNL